MLSSALSIWGYLSLLLFCGLALILVLRRARTFTAQSAPAFQQRFLELETISKLEETVLNQKLEIARLETQLRVHEACPAQQQSLLDQLKTQQEVAQTLRLAEQQARLEAAGTQKSLEEKIAWLTQSEERLKVLFENLANLCLEQTTSRTQLQQQKTLSELLVPFREQLDSFQTQIQEKFNYESKERHLLKHELTKVQELNFQLSQDAANLTQALLGNQKSQGAWGELLLERALEAAGLRKNEEYKLQVSLNQSQSDQKIQPDALISLPQGKSVIIDSKISLTAYSRYMNSEEPERSKHLSAHLNSLKTHIKGLGKKAYQQAKGIESLDFVLLFVPLEPAFHLALEHAPELLQEAQAQHIMLVSPTTLLVALKTIQNLWQFERRANHANLIAHKAGQLYDKFRLFLESFQAVGTALDRAQSEYHSGFSRLAQGKGNILRQIESFKELGVTVQKPLPSIASDHFPLLETPELESVTLASESEAE